MCVALCMLNYNGSQDTIDCLDSIKKYDSDFDGSIFILDNGSETTDLENLISGLNELFPDFQEVDIVTENDVINAIEKGVYLFKSKENYGFARGNNLLMRIAMESRFEFVLLQNNDTVLVDNTISRLVSFANEQSECAVATTDIRYFNHPDETWNAGGFIYAGTRKYNKNREVSKARSRGLSFIKVTYITGCFMLIRVDVLKKIGLLSDKFFFGEEDYDFSMRLKANGLIEYCLLDTYILHKLGKSSERASSSESYARKFVHRLNRMIDMRQHYTKVTWNLWVLITFLYLICRLHMKENIRGISAIRYLSKLYRMSITYKEVDKELFLYLYGQNNNFFVQ